MSRQELGSNKDSSGRRQLACCRLKAACISHKPPCVCGGSRLQQLRNVYTLEGRLPGSLDNMAFISDTSSPERRRSSGLVNRTLLRTVRRSAAAGPILRNGHRLLKIR
mmetsp:Transcript_61708/g.111020  ORF Transcript_61708/g.111020 Transcript_61708/m.111020 type:complete len:108 (-) Transcript_61708:198-521(-)